ncbi:MAG: hypothetical protein COB15_06115 [Flavobacteriales bacterium]|nr:MAG: hypothetical protein COB15_06115 [Flavobacteriales bacterium]
MKKTTLIFLATIMHVVVYAQELFKTSEAIDKTTSITLAQIIDPGFEDYVLYRVAEGATMVSQKKYFLKVDRTSLEVKEIIQLEKNKSIKLKKSYQELIAGPKCIYLTGYSEDKVEKTIDFYCSKLDDTFDNTKPPVKLFTGPIPKASGSVALCENTSLKLNFGGNIMFLQNETKDLITIKYTERLKRGKQKIDVYHCRVFDSNFKELYKTTCEERAGMRLDNFSYFHFDYLAWSDGVISVDPQDKFTLKIMNVKKTSEHSIALKNDKMHNIEAVKNMGNGKMIVCGAYLSAEKRHEEGVFRAEIDLKTNKLLSYERQEMTQIKKHNNPRVADSFISDEGNVYFLSCFTLLGIGQNYAVYFISNTGEVWSKHVPIPVQNVAVAGYLQTIKQRVFLKDNNLCILYNDHKKSQEIEPNSFVMGEKIGSINLQKPSGLISMLKIDNKGELKRKSFKIETGEFITGFSSNDGYNLYSPSRKVSGISYSKSRVIKFDFSKF